jgi:hypothetical protein
MKVQVDREDLWTTDDVAGLARDAKETRLALAHTELRKKNRKFATTNLQRPLRQLDIHDKVINPSRWLPVLLSPSCPPMALPAVRPTLYQRYDGFETTC